MSFWIAIGIATILVYLAVARQTGFKMFRNADGETRIAVPDWATWFSKPKEDGGKGSIAIWWSEKDLNQKRWFLYALLAAIAIGAAYTTDGKEQFILMGAVVLIGLHVVIWPFFTDKTSLMTKIIIGGFLFFCAAAYLFPNTANTTWKEVKTQAKNFDEGFTPDKIYSWQKTSPAVDSPASETLSIPMTVSSDKYIEVMTPAGYRYANTECPANAVMGIQGPNVPGGTLEIDCAEPRGVPAYMFEGARIGYRSKNSTPQAITVWYTKV